MKKIALICNYVVFPERVGGMDRFFWQFDVVCKENNIQVDWFFPKSVLHGNYLGMNIFQANESEPVEGLFLRNDSQYEIIKTHFVELCTSFSKKIKSKYPDSKLIAVDHNPRPIGGYPLKKKIIKRLKGILYAKYTNLFIGVSQYTVNEVLKDFGSHLNSKAKVIYNGIEIDKYIERQHRNHQNPNFLVACHLRESKGIQDLIEAIHLLEKSIKSNIKIDVYGDGPYKPILIELIQKYQLIENFDFKGSVPNLYEIYCNYDYLIHPSHMECFSLGLLESLASNVPVITTNVGGNEEVIQSGKNGFIFPAKDITSLNNIIYEIILGRNKIESNTRSLVEKNYSIEKMVQDYLELII